MPACVICIAQIGMSIALLCKEGGMDDSKMSGIVFIIGTAILILLVMVQQCFRIPVLMDVFSAVVFASNLATVFIYCFTKYPRASSTSSSLRLLQPDTTSESTLDIVRRYPFHERCNSPVIREFSSNGNCLHLVHANSLSEGKLVL